MKKKIILMSVAAVLAMTAIVGGTLAGFNTESKQGKTDISTKALGIELNGGSFVLNEETLVSDACMPGSEVEMPYYVTNNIADGYELYTRVTIYKYWEAENTALEADKISLYAKDAAGNPVKLALNGETGETVRIGDWFVQYADEEQVILYYAKPLVSGENTTNVLDYLAIDENVGNAYTNQRVVLDIEVDAVQRIAAESSIPSEWGVYPSFDENGNITAIAE